MRQPRLLDLFSGAGGAAVGYARAGFEVVGVDIKPQPNYPFDFICEDALECLSTFGEMWPDNTFDAIHASPPCQRFSVLTRKAQLPATVDLIGVVREMLRETGLPYVIENVPGAPLVDAYTLCGGAFGLGANGRHIQRHRLFECGGFELGLVPPCSHFGHQALGVYGNPAQTTGRRIFGGTGGYQGSMEEGGEALGIDWMRRRELSEAIPPAYTEFIGERLLEHLKTEVAA